MSYVHDRSAEALAPEILREAAAWFASLADASASEAERQSWREWLDASPDHARAWRRVEEVMGHLVPLTGAGVAARSALAETRRRRRRVIGALGVLLAAVGGTALLRMPWREWREEAAMQRADYRAGVGRISTTELADGSRIWLGSLGVLDLEYGSALRRLHLYRGDLLVETATDRALPARPFVVDTPHGRLRALGTRFAVRADPGFSRVDVYAGAVELTPAEVGEPVHVVHAGAHAVFDGTALRSVGQASPGRESWSRGILAADRMRLDELATELSRWHPVTVKCDPEVAALQVVGAYPIRDLDRIFAALSASLLVRALHEDGAIRLVAGEAPSFPTQAPDTPPRRIE
jgi:transmembrane sensor